MPMHGGLVGVPGRGVGAEGGALHGGRPEGRPEGNALEPFFPRVSTAAPARGSCHGPNRGWLGLRDLNATKRANHDDRQNGLNGPD